MLNPEFPEVGSVHDNSLHVLLLADEQMAQRLLAPLQEQFGRDHVTCLADVQHVASQTLDASSVMLCHVPTDGGEVIHQLRRLSEELAIVAILDEPDASLAAALFGAGAVDCVVATGELEPYIAIVVQKARLRKNQSLRDAEALREVQYTMRQLQRRNRELRESITRLETMAWTDALTGLANRRQLEDRLPQLFAESTRYNTDLTCLMIDLDGFKQINDTLGHTRGDELLIIVGEIIHEQVRAADLAARYGGDEFAIIMPQTDWKTGMQVGERLCSAFVRLAATSASGGVRCSMSVGVASLLMSRPISGHELIAHADNALYAAKHEGKNTVMVCGPDGVNPEVIAA